MRIELEPIGHVRGGRYEASDDHWGEVRAAIELDANRFAADAVAGLDRFSHLEVLFHFHQVSPEKVVRGARRPRGRADWPEVGIFAQRGKARPNRLAVTVCRLLEVDGLRLTVQGLDAIDGTPVLDLKPYMTGFAPRGEVRQPPWAVEIMAEYW
ncbi:MAG: SAM-dependent methyltransferase [Alphaproteobacteria bacterium]|jgi:tRNA-Thr(GGU) m(6)t(6)A37 methyltransferase TsaA|nr:SAM-dependent methyltransferase [Alphaproteobacteria bacterium]MDP6565889.1 SAM-dependent methyltransferase [Alphaproteobacteria bacterium]MDP6813723.1 SAM-dependent methyltransferase [Alphaproteobacteria bacterium]